MPLFDLIILGLLIGALVLLIVLVAMKWKRLRLIDVEAMPAAKLRKKKYKLIEGRLQRRTGSVRERYTAIVGPVMERSRAAFHAAYDKLIALEKKYTHQSESSKPQTQEDKEKRRQKVAKMIETGAEQFKSGNLGEAEQMFLDIIRLNPKEVEAYEYLGEVYLEKKEYDHAIETLDFAKKLNPNDDRIYYDLAMVHRKQGDNEKALELFKQAVDLAPKNPKNLDTLLDVAIEMKDRFLARETLWKLREANPENNKLDELEQIVKDL